MASSDSHCARCWAPPGGSGVSPTGTSTLRTTSTSGPWTWLLVRIIVIARRTSGREKNRSPPRTWYGTPTSVSACS